MYSIQNWIYGIPVMNEKTIAAFKRAGYCVILAEEIGRNPDTDECFDIKEHPLIKMHSPYHGRGSDFPPRYFGFLLKQTDECCDYLAIAPMKVAVNEEEFFHLQPDQTQMDAMAKWWESLPMDVRNDLPPPGIYVVFSTS